MQVIVDAMVSLELVCLDRRVHPVFPGLKARTDSQALLDLTVRLFLLIYKTQKKQKSNFGWLD